MSSIPQSPVEQPGSPRSQSVVLGGTGFLNVVLRLTGAEVYKILRRRMSKVLLIIAIPIMIIIFAFISLGTIFAMSRSASSYVNQCTTTSTGSSTGAGQPSSFTCTQSAPTQAQLDEAQKVRQQEITSLSAPLRLPGSINASVMIIDFIGLIILVILAGTIVGGEYSVGTIRLLLTRGPTRTQYLLAKVLSILLINFLVLIVLMIIGIIVGSLLNLISGIGVDTSVFTAVWFLHLFLFILVATLGLFVFTMLALCLSTLGKATVAGITGALVWWFLEGVLSTVLLITGTLNSGPFGSFLKAIPDYFIGNNISALLANQNHYLDNATVSSISDVHAILVLAAYLVVFIGGAWWVQQKRDITN